MPGSSCPLEISQWLVWEDESPVLLPWSGTNFGVTSLQKNYGVKICLGFCFNLHSNKAFSTPLSWLPYSLMCVSRDHFLNHSLTRIFASGSTSKEPQLRPPLISIPPESGHDLSSGWAPLQPQILLGDHSSKTPVLLEALATPFLLLVPSGLGMWTASQKFWVLGFLLVPLVLPINL